MQLSLPWSSWPMSRGAAFSFHVAISVLVFSSLVAMMLLFWFPGELFFIDGGWQGLKLVAMVDLVLGPALTLLLYKPNKPNLILDMSLIAAIQIAALAYGFYTTHQQRTLAVVFAEKTFFTVSASENLSSNEKLRELDLEPQPIPKASMLKVPMLLAPDPTPEEYPQFLENIMNGYPGPQQRSDRYVLLAEHTSAMKKHSLNTQTLEALGASSLIASSLEQQSLQQDKVEFYKFKARYGEGIVVFDPETASILDYIKIEPTNVSAAETMTVAEQTQ